MLDREGRDVYNLRISVTQKCNLTCDYCHREGESEEAPLQSTDKEMSLETIKNIVASAVKAGITKIKITGGEPTLRPDIVEIVKIIRSFSEIKDVSMTTNGHFLEKLAAPLRSAGLDRVNIGCDSLSSSIVKGAQDIRKGLDAIKEAGYENTKLNMVVLKGINEHEIEDIIAFAKEYGAILQLIELINSDPAYYREHYYPLKEVEEGLSQRAVKVTERKMHGRKIYDLGGVEVEIVSPFHGNFCNSCTRLRVTSNGELKPCLMREDNLVPYEGDESFEQAIDNRRIFR